MAIVYPLVLRRADERNISTDRSYGDHVGYLFKLQAKFCLASETTELPSLQSMAGQGQPDELGQAGGQVVREAHGQPSSTQESASAVKPPTYGTYHGCTGTRTVCGRLL